MYYHPKHKHPTQQLQDAWCELLGRYFWTWFVTHTFREEVHPERADKLWRVWCNQINQTLYGKNFYKKHKKGLVQGIYWVRAIEYQKNGVLHFHALVSGCESQNQFDWKENWLNLDGDGLTEGITGISRIYPIEEFKNYQAVIVYVSKYVAKGGQIDVSPNLQGYTQNLLSGTKRNKR